MKHRLIVNFILTSIIIAISTNSYDILGNPPITHFTRNDYKNASQFWDACQDQNGNVFFGNNNGILIFDGARWDHVKIPNHSGVRSLLATSDHRIFAGAFNEIGNIRHNSKGYYYESMMELIPAEYRNFGNLWGIHEINNTFIFRSFSYLFIYQEGRMAIIEADDQFQFGGICNDLLFVVDSNQLQIININTLQTEIVLSLSEINNEEILKILPTSQTTEIHLLTRQGSLYLVNLKFNNSSFIQKLATQTFQPPYISAVQSKNGKLFIGSLSHKMHSWIPNGEYYTPARHYSNLQDNTVLSIFESKEETIWALLDKGLDYFDPNSFLTNIFKGSSVYDVVIFENRMYLATNEGVFRSSEKQSNNSINQIQFKKVANTEGQAWSLQVVNGILLCGHDNGLYTISNGIAQKIPGFSGVWKLYPVVNSKNEYFVNLYNGMGLISIIDGEINPIEFQLPGFEESTRDILTDESHSYWVCHGYKGVYRIKTSSNNRRIVGVEHFSEQDGLPSTFNINAHWWNNQVVFTTNHGIYFFDKETNRFKRHEKLNALLGDDLNIRQIIDKDGISWCVIDDEIAFFKTEKMDSVIRDPFLSLKGTLNQSMECLVPYSNKGVLIGTSFGLYSFDIEKYEKTTTIQPGITISRLIFQIEDSLIIHHIPDPLNTITIPHKATNIQFFFNAPFIRDKATIQYSYWLEGQSHQWTNWQSEASVIYPHLKSGEYLFHVKGRSLSGEITNTAVISLLVEPVWYASRIFLIIWTLSGITVIYLIVLWVRIIVKKEKAKTQLEEKKHQRILEIELEKIKLEQERKEILKDKEQLESDVVEKSKDLANYTMFIAKKQELLIELQDELNNIRQQAKSDNIRSKILNLTRTISVNLNNQQQFKLFDSNLERVHKDLFDLIKSHYPDMSSKDLRLCAFIKMELTNKEMASVLNISVRGLETARYRLRKNYPEIDELIEKSKNMS
ncbi:triple tyrosine motif-containing protein [Natronoflexus pectinivorans]|uniref:YXYXY domain-containing protein n=1 Tax=Natronoflexus pectinivorans TaxID=682526 RepID=A0A4V2RWR6_9BACT|nr:triple tyrosine motif-containing protein [Natronoflexus pectinivorans]TCO09711.1 YXYXY domain-containing protein [Natronoflexus pectinivorans]